MADISKQSSGNLFFYTKTDPITDQPLPAEGRRKIFISYKKSDNKQTVNDQRPKGLIDVILHKILNRVDVAVWVDTNLTTGREYESEIISAISECDAMVLLLTPHILESKFVWEVEVDTAQKQKKGIIPISFNIPREEYAKVEQKLGKVQILKFPGSGGNGQQSSQDTSDAKAFNDSLQQALESFVINADLALRVEQFFRSNRHISHIKDLTDEQKYLMGFGYLRGVGIERDEHKGIKILDKLINGLYDEDETDKETIELVAQAAMDLVRYYAKLGKAKETAKYVTYAETTQKPDLLNELGVILCDTENLPHNYKKGIELFNRAANMGFAKSVRNLAICYQNGEGTDKNIAEAIRLYHKAGEMGAADAYFSLALLYDNGEDVTPDKTTAAMYYTKAADMGDMDAKDSLGYMYQYGTGVELNKQKAFDLYQEAANANNEWGLYHLGYMYDVGDGVTEDQSKAAQLYQKASDLGHASASYNLAIMCYNGKGVPTDKAKAADLFQKSADLGDQQALRNLGYMYYTGDGITASTAKALEFFQKSADLGDAASVYNIGIIYENENDQAKAIDFYRKAAAMGYQSAADRLKALSAQ